MSSSLMNTEQKCIYDHVLQNERFKVFIDGVAGTGKSFLIGQITTALEKRGIKCFLLSYTAKAASNINGYTIYKVFGFNEDRDSAFIYRGKKGYKLQRCKGDEVFERYERFGYMSMFTFTRNPEKHVEDFKIFNEDSRKNCIIIDEISMVSLQLLDDISECLKTTFDYDDVFGGINYIVSGHYSQLRPVSGTAIYMLPNEMKHFIKDTTLRFLLTKNQRQEDTEFFELCNSVMVSCLSSKQKKLLRTRMITNFPDLDFSKKLHIFPTRISCETHNLKHLVNLDSSVYYFIKACETGEKKAINTKERLLFKGLPNAVVLSNDCKVMITANNGEYINSETYFIKDIHLTSSISKRDFYTGLTDSESTVFKQLEKTLPNKIVYCNANRVSILLDNGDTLSPIDRSIESNGLVIFTRTMFPLSLSWAVTTHKIQGSTLDEAVVDMSKDNFDPVQVYVNITRLKKIEGLYISKLDLPFKKSNDVGKIKKFLGEMVTMK